MILTHERESVADPIMSTKLFNDAGPDSVLFVLHQRSVANDEHSVLRPRQKDICAVGRLEKPDPSRVSGVVGDVVSDQRDDDDLGLLPLH